MVCRLAANEPGVEVVAGIDILSTGDGLTFPIYGDINECAIESDAIIDFLPPTAEADTLAVVEYSVKKQVPLVLCTTGLSADINVIVKKSSEKVAILQSPNMSLGVNLLSNMLNRAAKLLYDANFDIEIVEKHHNQKLDSPSGTALMLADTVNNALGGNMRLVYDRSQTHVKRSRDEIGVHAMRGGSIVGEHSVIFAGFDEVIELTHIAQSRDAFAVGALNAARFVHGKPAGLYDMQDLINQL